MPLNSWFPKAENRSTTLTKARENRFSIKVIILPARPCYWFLVHWRQGQQKFSIPHSNTTAMVRHSHVNSFLHTKHSRQAKLPIPPKLFSKQENSWKWILHGRQITKGRRETSWKWILKGVSTDWGSLEVSTKGSNYWLWVMLRWQKSRITSSGRILATCNPCR